MSHSAGSQGWERFKNAIRILYIAKGHTLEGPDGVIKLMENRHGFRKTKAQYENHFKEWGFQKSRTRKDWKIMSQKIELRKRMAKESDVYLNGQLVPRKKLRKEISRQGYMTFAEQFNQAQETLPQTPPRFEIRTPINQPYFRLVFENLPILQFQENIQPLGESIKTFDIGFSALVPLLGKSNQTNDTDFILPVINSLLPNSAFLEEVCAKGLAIERLEKLGPVEFFNLTTFLISNNSPMEASSEHLYKWLKSHGGTSVLKVLSSMEGPTAEALLENLFLFAIELEDIPIVKYLIQAGVNPNGHACRHARIPDNLTPLQFACLRGNTELALELIKAGSSIDQPGTGWKSSALVLAIIGEGLRDNQGFWGVHGVWRYKFEYQNGQETQDNEIFQEETGRILDLINSLIDAGAAVNLDNVDKFRLKVPGLQGDAAWDLDCRVASIMQDGHSPLTAASKYRNKELVDLLIQKGADVKYLTDKNTSAILECLYSSEEIELDHKSMRQPFPLSKRGPFFRGSRSLSKVVGVVRSLLEAGADANSEFTYYPVVKYDDTTKDCYTALDLSVLTGSVELVDMMLCAGVCPTMESVAHAIDVGNLEIISCLLSAGAPLSTRAAISAMRKDSSGQYVQALLAKRQDIRIKKALLVEAIRLRAISVIERLFNHGTSSPRELIHECPGLTSAIESCCDRGHIDVLRLILDKSSAYQFSISPWLGQSIRRAVLSSHDEIVDALLSAGADVNAMTDDGETALLAAVHMRNERIIDALLSAGADVNAITGGGKTALLAAVNMRNERIIDALLSAGADVYAMTLYGETVLLAAVRMRNKRIIMNLISAGATLNTEKSFCSSGIHNHTIFGDILISAIEWGDFTVIKNILEAGANMEALGRSRIQRVGCSCITPLIAAIMEKDLNLVNYLLCAGVAINNPPHYLGTGMTPLSAAIRNGDFKLVDSLIQIGANPYDARALEEATNDFRLLQVLLTALRSSDRISDNKNLGRGALYAAIEKQDLVMIRAILDSPLIDINSTELLSDALYQALFYDDSLNFEIIRLLLSLGADPNVAFQLKYSQYFKSALSVAIGLNDPQKVQLLLEAGAQADLSRDMRCSPMQLAVSNRNQDIVQKLLNYGSDPNAVSLSQDSRTPIQVAVDNQDQEMVRILLQYNGNPNAVFDDMKATPLQMATRNGSKEMVELLLEHGADVNSPPAKEFGATALQFAAIKGLLGIAYLLLENGADVNAPPAESHGRTALEGAAEHGRIDMVQLLLNAGANIFQDGQSQYESAVRRASENGHHSIRRLLESYRG